MDKRKVYYEGRGQMVSFLLSDLDTFIPAMRNKEAQEIKDIDKMAVEDAVRYSYEAAQKRFSYIVDGQILVIAGVADLPSNAVISRRLSLLDGKGGIPYLFSVDASTGYKFEIARSCAPILFREIKEGYDFLTIWVAEYMTELFKLALLGGFKPVERGVHPISKAIFIRVAWHRDWEEVRQ